SSAMSTRAWAERRAGTGTSSPSSATGFLGGGLGCRSGRTPGDGSVDGIRRTVSSSSHQAADRPCPARLTWVVDILDLLPSALDHGRSGGVYPLRRGEPGSWFHLAYCAADPRCLGCPHARTDCRLLRGAGRHGGGPRELAGHPFRCQGE